MVGGDDLISALACGVGVLSVEGERVGGEEAGVRKMLDDSSMLLEREQMGECDVEERERVRLERRVAREEEKKRLRESEKAAKEAARSEARVLKAAEKKVELEERKAAKAAERSAKKAEKEAEKVAAKEAAKAAKVAAKEAAKAAKKAAKEAEKKTNKTNKTKKTKSAAPELLAAVADCDLYCCNGELVPQAFLVDSEASADVPMMKQPSTGYEAAPMRSGDSFCDP